MQEATSYAAAPDAGRRRFVAPLVRLTDADPDLLLGLSGQEAATARHLLTAPLRVSEAGAEITGVGEPGSEALLLTGFVAHATRIAGRESIELIGPGGLVVIDQPSAVLDSQPIEHQLRSLTGVRLAILDVGVWSALARYPAVAKTLSLRRYEQARELAIRMALAQAPRLEVRLLGSLWHLADRWGVVTPQGVVIPVPLTNGLLAALTASQRPSVSVAMKTLVERGEIERVDQRHWRLIGQPL
jgi:CRP/FNR family cyclic AMP-dependent transcriptional regulator